MRGRTLTAVVAVFDVLLGVVPSAAAAGHRQGEEQAGDDRAEQEAAHHFGAAVVRQNEAEQHDDDRHADRNEGRQHHLFECRLRDDVDRRAVVRLLRSVHDAGHLTELAPDFFDDGTRRPSNRLHRERSEQVGQQTADEQTA